MNEPECKNCTFFVNARQYTHPQGWGQCRRFPRNSEGQFALASKDDWCGEFKEGLTDEIETGGYSMTDTLSPTRCRFCGSTSVITMPNDRARYGPELGHEGRDAFYCHCEGCGADGPIADDYWKAIRLWNNPMEDKQWRQ